MSNKDVVFYLLCTVAWIILLPVLMIGTIALVSFAVFSELREYMLGRSAKDPDHSAAREAARRLCLAGSRSSA